VRGLVTLASFLVLAAPRVAAAQERVPRVGVVIELTVDVDATRADAIGKSLADALTRTLEVDAFGGGDVSRRLPAEGLPEECLGNPGCITDIAARLDADQLLFLALAQIGTELQIDASWVDITSGQVTARPRLVLPDDTKAFQTFLEQAPRYLPDAPVRAARSDHVGDGGVPTRTIPAVPRHMTTASWISAGATVGFLGAGAVFGVMARSTYTRCESIACPEDDLDGLARNALIADLSFGAAAGAAIVTAILYLRSGTPATEVLVTQTPGGAVLGVSGRW
jgi:hypothetical protein